MPNEELRKIIKKWQDWLTIQRNYSNNTTQSYLNDIETFFNYISKNVISIKDLEELTIRDFRNFFSARARKKISKATIARQESAIKNLFKYLNENNIIKNTAIFQISSPKLPKLLPKAIEVDLTFDIIDEAKKNCKEPWIGLRDTAIFILLYGCGLRISEALSLNLEDINNTDFIKIKGKGNKERYVPTILLEGMPVQSDGRNGRASYLRKPLN